MPQVDLDTIEDFCENNKKTDESRLQYFKRVLATIFTANPWVLYRKDQYIAKDGKGNLSRFQKLEEQQDAESKTS